MRIPVQPARRFFGEKFEDFIIMSTRLKSGMRCSFELETTILTPRACRARGRRTGPRVQSVMIWFTVMPVKRVTRDKQGEIIYLSSIMGEPWGEHQLPCRACASNSCMYRPVSGVLPDRVEEFRFKEF